MATAWPEKRRLIGKDFTRADGPVKSTGMAKYSFDMNLPGMSHAIMLRSPYAHCKVKKIDSAAAEKMPGVKAFHLVIKEGDELYFAGDEILAIAADTEEHARDAVRAVKIDYEVLPFLVEESDALKNDKKTVRGVGPKKEANNLRPPIEAKTEKFEEGMAAAEATVEGEYGASTICHQCLESHGLVAAWDKEGGLTVYASTQAVFGTAQALSRHFQAQKVDLPENKVKCITQHMGGGYGSKFGPDIQGIVAAELARKAKAPVKLMLDRADEATVGGTRPSAYGKVKIAGKKDGTITAIEFDSWGSPGVGNGATVGPLPYVYVLESKRKHTIVRLNVQEQRAMRAPGHPQSCLLTDCAIDDFAAKIGMDPLQVRIKNLPPNDADSAKTDPLSILAIRHTLYTKQIDKIVEMCKWKENWRPPGSRAGVVKYGIGMALHTWGGQASPQKNETTVIITSDGSVTALSSTQDLGTAQRTVTAVVCAEILGLQPTDITVKIGDNSYGESTGSGGSTTCPSQAPAALRAVTAARDDLFAKVAMKLGAKKEDLSLDVGGKVTDKASKKTYEWKQVCARLGMDQAKGVGGWTYEDSQKEENKNVSKVGVGGVQVAEALVDTETGVVRLKTIYAVQDCGMIINRMACESQVTGGVIMGLNYALFEERIMDRTTGRQVNPDMEFYKLGGIEDMPKVVVYMMDMPERGVIGIGEPPTISTHAAISNAIFNAIGVRVPHTPFSPDRVLAALAGKGGKA